MRLSNRQNIGNRHAFTLIELLVVIAIIGLLLAVIIPALKSAKNIAAAAVCLANEGQLIKSWLLYADDYDARVVDGDTSDSLTDPGFEWHRVGQNSVRIWCWVGRPMGFNNTDSNKTVDDKIRGFEAGALWPYVEAPKVYNCPVDKRYVKPAVCPRNNCNAYDADWIGGYRSYSIGKVLSQRPAGGSGEDEYTITKLSEFSLPGSKIVFLEESDGMGWNHRTWNMDMNPADKEWIDPFAIWHNGSSTLAYADGHAERRKWESKGTLIMAEKQEKNLPATEDGTVGGVLSRDYIWFRRAYIPGK